MRCSGSVWVLVFFGVCRVILQDRLPDFSPKIECVLPVRASRRASFARPGRARLVQVERPTGRTTWTRRARSGCLWCAMGRRAFAGIPEPPWSRGGAPAAGGHLRVVGPEALPAGGRFVPQIIDVVSSARPGEGAVGVPSVRLAGTVRAVGKSWKCRVGWHSWVPRHDTPDPNAQVCRRCGKENEIGGPMPGGLMGPAERDLIVIN
jgi:hypothetical protein